TEPSRPFFLFSSNNTLSAPTSGFAHNFAQPGDFCSGADTLVTPFTNDPRLFPIPPGASWDSLSNLELDARAPDSGSTDPAGCIPLALAAAFPSPPDRIGP